MPRHDHRSRSPWRVGFRVLAILLVFGAATLGLRVGARLLIGWSLTRWPWLGARLGPWLLIAAGTALLGWTGFRAYEWRLRWTLDRWTRRRGFTTSFPDLSWPWVWTTAEFAQPVVWLAYSGTVAGFPAVVGRAVWGPPGTAGPAGRGFFVALQLDQPYPHLGGGSARWRVIGDQLCGIRHSGLPLTPRQAERMLRHATRIAQLLGVRPPRYAPDPR